MPPALMANVHQIEATALALACEREPLDPAPLLIYADWLEQEAQNDEACLSCRGTGVEVASVPDHQGV